MAKVTDGRGCWRSCCTHTRGLIKNLTQLVQIACILHMHRMAMLHVACCMLHVASVCALCSHHMPHSHRGHKFNAAAAISYQIHQLVALCSINIIAQDTL